jgi:hypothetical protein
LKGLLLLLREIDTKYNDKMNEWMNEWMKERKRHWAQPNANEHINNQSIND